MKSISSSAVRRRDDRRVTGFIEGMLRCKSCREAEAILALAARALRVA
jgi:hypothetical protein